MGTSRVSKADLERFLSGHRFAEARLRQEALRRLPLLTIEEARDEYDALCRVWESSRGLGDEAALDQRAIRDRVALRSRLAGRK